ncbi:MAG: alpha/beta fold hydrolase [Pedobacter sp.]|nr:MAG: alpha/beta fold hydrolase [Pedobacter sp.]
MNKQNLLFLHGALGDKSQLDIPGLNENFNIHKMDFPGHGKAVLQEKFGIEVFAEAVLNYMDANNLTQTDIFGYSMGGYVAAYLAMNQPERIGKIFTLGTKFLWTNEYAELETKKLNADKIQEKVPQFAEQLKQRHTALDWRDLLSHTSQMMRDLGNSPLFTPENLTQIKHKIRIGIGDRDNTVTIEEAQKVQQSLLNAELEVFPNTPHPFERVNQKRILFILKEFFDLN